MRPPLERRKMKKYDRLRRHSSRASSTRRSSDYSGMGKSQNSSKLSMQRSSSYSSVGKPKMRSRTRSPPVKHPRTTVTVSATLARYTMIFISLVLTLLAFGFLIFLLLACFEEGTREKVQTRLAQMSGERDFDIRRSLFMPIMFALMGICGLRILAGLMGFIGVYWEIRPLVIVYLTLLCILVTIEIGGSIAVIVFFRTVMAPSRSAETEKAQQTPKRLTDVFFTIGGIVLMHVLIEILAIGFGIYVVRLLAYQVVRRRNVTFLLDVELDRKAAQSRGVKHDGLPNQPVKRSVMNIRNPDKPMKSRSAWTGRVKEKARKSFHQLRDRLSGSKSDSTTSTSKTDSSGRRKSSNRTSCSKTGSEKRKTSSRRSSTVDSSASISRSRKNSSTRKTHQHQNYRSRNRR